MKADLISGRLRGWGLGSWALVALAALLTGGAAAQTVDFEPLLIARETTALLEHDGLVVGGLRGGGLVLWNAGSPSEFERLTAGDELSGNSVTALSWSGRNVWVATLGGGLTRIVDLAGARTFRRYTSNLSSLDVTAVTGTIVGSSERVYYGTAESGIGVISDGISGAVYNAEQDGLISDNVTAVQVLDGALFVGTPVGVSRLSNNIFSDQNAGLGNLAVNGLGLDSDGFLLAATGAGVYRWDDNGEVWSLVGADLAPAQAVSSRDGLIYVLGTSVRVYNGSNWQTLAPPSGIRSAIYAGNDFWVGGRLDNTSDSGFTIRSAYLGRRTGGTGFDVFEVDASQVQSAAGVAFSGKDPYLSAQAFRSVISSRHDDVWSHVRYQPPTTENEGDRLGEGVILRLAAGPDGAIWAALYAGTGLARIDPTSGVTDLISPTNSGLLESGIVNVVVHPDGPVITLHDWSNTEKVEILVDPDNWSDAGNWLVLPRAGGLGDGPTVWDAVVQRPDVIWFAVQAVGLVRWDINGDQAGPDDPLTWLDQSDDRWDPPLASVPGSLADLRGTVGLAVGADGSIWAGGNGLVQFTYDAQDSTATKLTSLAEKTDNVLEGLAAGVDGVRDIARDANGDIWTVTSGGVNRVRGSGTTVAVDTYLDLANYFANPLNGLLYSPNVISPLPGSEYRSVAASADGKQILISADQGASLVTVGPGGGDGTGQTATGPYVYPNPFPGDLTGGGLKLGGLVGTGPASVEIYNLDGQLVYVDPQVSPETGFWNGQNRVGQEVATGMYLVRVTEGRQHWSLALAVVR